MINVKDVFFLIVVDFCGLLFFFIFFRRYFFGFFVEYFLYRVFVLFGYGEWTKVKEVGEIESDEVEIGIGCSRG